MPSSGESSAYQFLELPFFAALDSSLAVAGQLSPGDMAAIREAGFSCVINNRPDGEGGPRQPSHTEMKAAADAVGLHYVYQ
ncbi:MAG: beta-lactamase hydrolase domain-containing protein, partial [Burkholderiales bacterium]